MSGVMRDSEVFMDDGFCVTFQRYLNAGWDRTLVKFK